MKRLLSILIIFFLISEGGCQTAKSVNDVEKLIEVITRDYPEKKQLEAYEKVSELAMQGNLDAKVFLGCDFLAGVRTERNIDLGLKYLYEGVEGGSTDAMFCLSQYYYRESQFDQYIRILEACIQLDGLFCKVELGSFLLNGTSIYFNYIGSKKNLNYQDVKRAFSILESASEAGSSDASFILGKAYFNGENVEKDYIKAKTHFKKCLEDPYFTKFDSVEEYLKKLD